MRREIDVLLEKIWRRIEEDRAAADASFCEAIAQRPGEFQNSTFQYLSECFEVAAQWNLILVSN